MEEPFQIRYFSEGGQKKSEFRRLSMLFHPDKVPVNFAPTAQNIFDKMRRSFNSLSNPISAYLYSKHKFYGLRIFEHFHKYFIPLEEIWNKGDTDFSSFLAIYSSDIERIYENCALIDNFYKQMWFSCQIVYQIELGEKIKENQISIKLSKEWQFDRKFVTLGFNFNGNPYEKIDSWLTLSLRNSWKVFGNNLVGAIQTEPLDLTRTNFFLSQEVFGGSIALKVEPFQNFKRILVLKRPINQNSLLTFQIMSENNRNPDVLVKIGNFYQISKELVLKYSFSFNRIKASMSYNLSYQLSKRLQIKCVTKIDHVWAMNPKDYYKFNEIRLQINYKLRQMNSFFGTAYNYYSFSKIFFGFGCGNFRLEIPIMLSDESVFEVIAFGVISGVGLSLIRWFSERFYRIKYNETKGLI